MPFRRVLGGIAVALFSILVAGCAATGSSDGGGESERFEAGREAWISGNYGRAFELLITEAEAGNADAQYTIGYMYYVGQGVQQDEDAAIRWIQQAAGNGSERAMEALGELASFGVRDRRERAEAAPDEDLQAPD